MKSPDDIKKGLECCTSRDCGGSKCPYFNEKSCNAAKSADAIALIQQLQAENAEQAERIKQLEAERDAAVDDLEDYATVKCFACKYYEMELTEAPCDECKIMGKGNRDMFEWRGVQKEATQ